MALRIRRGTDAQRTGKTFEVGEIVYTTDSQQVWIGNGVTAGGIPVVGSNVAGFGLVYNPTSKKIDVSGLTTDDVSQGTNNKYFSTELAVDAVGAALVAGNPSNVGITFTYAQTQDDAGRINATVDASAFTDLGLTDIVNDTTPELGGSLNINSFNITGTGNISITGNLTATGGTVTASQYGTVNANKLFLTDNTSSGVVNAGLLFTTNVGGDSGEDFIQINTHHADSEPVTQFFSRTKGTSVSPTTLANGDGIFNLGFKGYTTNSTYGVAVGLGAEVDGTVAGGILPGKFVIYTSNTLGALLPALELGSSQTATFGGRILATDGTTGAPSIAFATDGSTDTGFSHPGDGIIGVSTNGVETARFDTGGFRSVGFVKVKDFAGTLPSSPEAGMIVLDGATFKGYNGSAWVDLN